MSILVVKQIPFAHIHKAQLPSWECKKTDQYNRDIQPVHTTYVSLGSLKEVADEIKKAQRNDLIHPRASCWQGTPGFMSPFWVNGKIGDKPTHLRFDTGSYKSMQGMLFMDDVFEWAHHRIKSHLDVRSAIDICWNLAGGSGIIDNGKYFYWDVKGKHKLSC